MRPEQGRWQVTTQVKGLSPETILIREADAFHFSGRQQDIETVKGEVSILLAGSKAVTWHQEDELGTWETQDAIPLFGKGSNKL